MRLGAGVFYAVQDLDPSSYLAMTLAIACGKSSNSELRMFQYACYKVSILLVLMLPENAPSGLYVTLIVSEALQMSN